MLVDLSGVKEALEERGIYKRLELLIEDKDLIERAHILPYGSISLASESYLNKGAGYIILNANFSVVSLIRCKEGAEGRESYRLLQALRPVVVETLEGKRFNDAEVSWQSGAKRDFDRGILAFEDQFVMEGYLLTLERDSLFANWESAVGTHGTIDINP